MEIPHFPEEVASLDPDEFIGAFEYSVMVAENQFVEEIPEIDVGLRLNEFVEIKLPRDMGTMFALAAAKHFRDQPEKCFAFMWRAHWMLTAVKDGALSEFVNPGLESNDIDEPVFRVAATFPLRTKDGFDLPRFAARVREEDAGLED